MKAQSSPQPYASSKRRGGREGQEPFLSNRTNRLLTPASLPGPDGSASMLIA
jgi:hypothetical protein